MTKTILLVDNDKQTVKENSEYLEEYGFAVKTADTSKEALEATEKFKPDAVITEIMLEHVDSGFTLCHNLKKKYPDMPVIILSDIVRKKGIEFDVKTKEQRDWINADEFIDKPVRPETVACIIGRYI